MPTLAAAAGAFAVTGTGTPPHLFAYGGEYAVSGSASLVRNMAVDIGDLGLRLTRLNSLVAIVDPKTGRPTSQFQLLWQKNCEATELAFTRLQSAVTVLQAAYDAAAQANAAAAAANDSVAQVQTAVAEVETLIESVEDGTFNFPQITVGGQTFQNNGGNIEPIP